MATVFDYLDWRGDLTFDRAPFSEVDALVLALISYIDFEGIVSGKRGGKTISLVDAAKVFFAQRPERDKITLGVLVPKEIVTLLDAAKSSPRFCDLKLGGYINQISEEEETQFCAMTFFLPTDEIVVAFRGTDDTIVGWRENCNMSFSACVPAQSYATEYLDQTAKQFPNRPIWVVGHSKGGNLAAYATLHCKDETSAAISSTYNLDGPGSQMEDWYGNASFQEKGRLIKTFVPEHSIVGLLLSRDPNLISIKSNLSGILQHNGLSWMVLGNTFLRAQAPGNDSLRSVGRLNDWVVGMTPDKRREAVDAIFSVFTASHASTLTELVAQKGLWLSKCRELDPAIFGRLQSVFSALLIPQKKRETRTPLLGELFAGGKKRR